MRTRLGASLVALAALAAALLPAAPAAAATLTVATWTDLQSALGTGGSNTVVLSSDITAPGGQSAVVSGTVVLDLAGFDLDIPSGTGGSAGLGVPPGASLRIVATGGGSLSVTGGPGGAGIGGGATGSSGTIEIAGGTISATGGSLAAGIGGGNAGNGGSTTISGGTVTAVGSADAAGIGGGNGTSGGGASGTILISGGTVTATGTTEAPGIGAGAFGAVGSITVSGGRVIATSLDDGPGIGSGYRSPAGGTVVLSGGVLSLSGENTSAAIGAGRDGDGPTVDIQGTPAAGAATTGLGPGGPTFSNSVTPAGVGYTAVDVSSGSTLALEITFTLLVTFDAAGGSAVADQTVDWGDTLSIADPVRAGFDFAGWTSGGSAFDLATPVTAPLSLVATWTPVSAAPTGPVLAESGVETGPALATGLALLVLGAAALVADRRRGRRV